MKWSIKTGHVTVCPRNATLEQFPQELQNLELLQQSLADMCQGWTRATFTTEFVTCCWLITSHPQLSAIGLLASCHSAIASAAFAMHILPFATTICHCYVLFSIAICVCHWHWHLATATCHCHLPFAIATCHSLFAIAIFRLPPTIFATLNAIYFETCMLHGGNEQAGLSRGRCKRLINMPKDRRPSLQGMAMCESLVPATTHDKYTLDMRRPAG